MNQMKAEEIEQRDYLEKYTMLRRMNFTESESKKFAKSVEESTSYTYFESVYMVSNDYVLLDVPKPVIEQYDRELIRESIETAITKKAIDIENSNYLKNLNKLKTDESLNKKRKEFKKKDDIVIEKFIDEKIVSLLIFASQQVISFTNKFYIMLASDTCGIQDNLVAKVKYRQRKELQKIISGLLVGIKKYKTSTMWLLFRINIDLIPCDVAQFVCIHPFDYDIGDFIDKHKSDSQIQICSDMGNIGASRLVEGIMIVDITGFPSEDETSTGIKLMYMTEEGGCCYCSSKKHTRFQCHKLKCKVCDSEYSISKVEQKPVGELIYKKGFNY